MLAASDVNTCSLKLELKPATLHQTAYDIGSLSNEERGELSSSRRVAWVKSPTKALYENKHISIVPGLHYDQIIMGDPEDEQTKLALESFTAGARFTTHVLNKGKYSYMFANSESESVEKSGGESLTTLIVAVIAAAKVSSVVGALFENNPLSSSANPNICTEFHNLGSKVPKTSAPPPLTYGTILSRAFSKSKRTSGPARAHLDSEDKSDAESAVASPFILTAGKGASAISTALSKAQQRLSMFAGPHSDSEDD